MKVILDGQSRRLAFQRPERVIAADNAAQVPAALAAVTEALAAGRHVAGWLGYELGYALEPRLWPLLQGAAPLLRLGVFAAPSDSVPLPAGRAYAGPLIPEWDEAAYGARFAAVKAAIAAGDIYQANLSFRAGFAFAGDALALYERLRGASGAAHCAFIDFFDEKMGGDRQILSLSPELFFELSASGEIVSRPMKGTAARHGDDAGESIALAQSAKDRAENLMIVDLIRNDLGRVALTGSVAVKDLFAVETYPTLHTMVSTVAAQKRPDAGVAEILRALFPCGSVTGAPKIRAMEILRELETSPRGAYCGAIGYFSPSALRSFAFGVSAGADAPASAATGTSPSGAAREGEGVNFSASFNVAIRTLTITGSEGVLGIGGGVVQDSQSAAEYAECLLKARFFAQGRPPLELIETLRFEGQFVRLERHLARMADSARRFGLAFDPVRARTALDAAVAGRDGALRVRLTLDEAGHHQAGAAVLEPNPPHWSYQVSTQRVRSGDLLQRHKTSWRALYEKEAGLADEAFFCNERGELAEGTRCNIFVEKGGLLLTPPLEAGALGGCLRAELIETGKAREAVLTPQDLKDNLVYCGNSLRGLIRAVPL